MCWVQRAGLEDVGVSDFPDIPHQDDPETSMIWATSGTKQVGNHK